MREFFEPTLYAYLAYCLEFCVRYFLLAGGLFLLFHVAFRQRWIAHRIQSTFPGNAEIRHEIVWSMINMACTGISTVFTYRLVHGGHTSMYFSVSDYGPLYFVASIAMLLVGYDTWIYFQHRFMHTDFMFHRVHWVHHRVGNPTPFATFAQHPVETFMGNVFFVLFVVFVPAHPYAVAAAGGYMFLYGILGHLGYEFFPRWVVHHPLLGLLNTATYHNIHHLHMRCNYGAWFILWDRVFGTEHSGYLPMFDEIALRRRGAGRDYAFTPSAECVVEAPQDGIADMSGADGRGSLAPAADAPFTERLVAS